MQQYFKTNLIDFGEQIGDDVYLSAMSDPGIGFEIIFRFGFFRLSQFKDKIMLMGMPVSVAVPCDGTFRYYAITKEAFYQMVLPRNGKTYESYVEKLKDDLSVYQEWMRVSGENIESVLKEDIENIKKITGGKK